MPAALLASEQLLSIPLTKADGRVACRQCHCSKTALVCPAPRTPRLFVHSFFFVKTNQVDLQELSSEQESISAQSRLHVQAHVSSYHKGRTEPLVLPFAPLFLRHSPTTHTSLTLTNTITTTVCVGVVDRSLHSMPLVCPLDLGILMFFSLLGRNYEIFHTRCMFRLVLTTPQTTLARHPTPKERGPRRG